MGRSLGEGTYGVKHLLRLSVLLESLTSPVPEELTNSPPEIDASMTWMATPVARPAMPLVLSPSKAALPSKAVAED